MSKCICGAEGPPFKHAPNCADLTGARCHVCGHLGTVESHPICAAQTGRAPVVGESGRARDLDFLQRQNEALYRGNETLLRQRDSLANYLMAACAHAEAGVLPHAEVILAWRDALSELVR